MQSDVGRELRLAGLRQMADEVMANGLQLNEISPPAPSALLTRPMLIRLDRDVGAATYLDEVVKRIVAMSKRFEGGDFVADDVWRLYAAKSPMLGLWVTLKGHRVVGHIYAQIMPYNGRYVAWVIQVESDDPVDQEMWDTVNQAIDQWVQQVNEAHARDPKDRVTEVFMETPREAKVWAKRGWSLHRSILKRAVR